MKTNKIILIKKFALIIVLTVFAVSRIFSQGNTLKLDGNNNGTSGSVIGFTNYADFPIITNNTKRLIVTKDGIVKIMKDLEVKGKFTSDSMRISKYIATDSIYTRCIKIGDSSIYIGSTGIQTGTSNLIQSDNGVLNFGNLNLSNFSDFTLGVGKQNGTFNPDISLDAEKGINISDANYGYYINGNEVLKYHGNPVFTPSTSNIFVGIGAGNSNTAGVANTANGYQALYKNITGGNNTANGYQALYNTTGYSNTANGMGALSSNTAGAANTANGMQALFNNTTGNYNIANGVRALFYNFAASNNTAMGYQALMQQGYGSSLVMTSDNVAIGVNALYNNNPTAITNGIRNTAVGNNSLFNNITGNNNTALGFNADVNSSSYNNATAIGANAMATASSQVRLGDNNVTTLYCMGALYPSPEAPNMYVIVLPVRLCVALLPFMAPPDLQG